MERTLGLIAGSGHFPLCVARSARARGLRVAAVAFRDFADPAIADLVDELRWLYVGELSALIEALRGAGVRDAIIAGQVPKQNLYSDTPSVRFDERAQDLLERLRDRRDHSILGALADLLASEGIDLRPQDELIPDLMAPRGHVAGPSPTPDGRADLDFGWPLAKRVAALQIGQTVVVKGRAVMAVEAIEGTDRAVRRGGTLGGPGTSVIKVARADQDPRFDLPTVGPSTLRAMIEVRAGLLAVEAGRSVLLDRDEMAQLANRHGIALLGVDPSGPESEDQ